MSPLRKTALVAGVFYLLTFVSIPTLFLYDQVRHNPKYILGPGPDTAVLFGGILEIIVALAGFGTAVVLYPVVKRQDEGRALGFVGARTLEAAGILAGGAPRTPDRAMGVFAGRLPHRQRLQALSYHRCHGGRGAGSEPLRRGDRGGRLTPSPTQRSDDRVWTARLPSLCWPVEKPYL